MVDVEKIENDIRGKLENVFDIRNIYDIFGSLITAIKDQNAEIKRLSSLDKSVESLQDKVSSMDKAIHIIEYNIQGFETVVDEEKEVNAPPSTSGSPIRHSRKKVSRHSTNDIAPGGSQVVPDQCSDATNRNMPDDEAKKEPLTSSVTATPTSTPASDVLSSPRLEEEQQIIDNRAASPAVAPPPHFTDDTEPLAIIEEQIIESAANTFEENTPVAMIEANEDQNNTSAAAEATEVRSEESEAAGAEIETPHIVEATHVEDDIDHVDEEEEIDLLAASSSAANWTEEQREQWRIKKRRILTKIHFYIKSTIALKKSYAGLTKSKLDPKLSVNNRIKTLEDNLIALSDLVNVHRRALEAVPARIKAAIPADLKLQLQKINASISRIDKNVAALSLNPNASVTVAQPSPAAPAPHNMLTPQLSPRPAAVQRNSGSVAETEPTGVAPASSAPAAPVIAAELPSNVLMLDSEGNVPMRVLVTLRKQLQAMDKADVDATATVEPTSVKSEPVERSIVVGGNRRNSRSAVSHLAKFQTSRDADEVSQRPDSADMTAYMRREDVEITASRIFNDLALQYVSKDELMLMVDNKSATAGSYNPYPFADRLKLIMAGEIKQHTEHMATKDDVVAGLKGLQASISLEMRRNEKQERENLLSVTGDIKERLDRVEIENKQLKTTTEQLQHTQPASSNPTPRKHELLSAQPSSSNLFRAQSKREGRLTSVGENIGASKTELIKLSESLKKVTEEHDAVVGKLSTSVENVMGMLSVRVTEEQVEKMLHNLEESMKQQVSTTVTTLSMALNNVLYAVKNKAGRDEVNTIVTSKLSEVQQSLHSKDNAGDDSDAPAGSTKCISCGTFTAKLFSLDSPSGSIGVVPDTRGDYEQMVTVLQRNAGLKPLNRHHNAVMPKPATAGSRVRSQEPLYRRAKVANQMREIPKIPLVTMSHSASSPSQLYVLDDSFDDNSVESNAAPASSDSTSFITTIPNAETLKLPRVNK